jgi:hypothetical protein
MSPPTSTLSRSLYMVGSPLLTANSTTSFRRALRRGFHTSITMASACPLLAVWNAISKSVGRDTSTYCSFSRRVSAAFCVSLSPRALPAQLEVPKTATRESLGRISFRTSSRFTLSSGCSVDNPVTFPPGRARLVTNPLSTGSLSDAMTMGIVAVASLAGAVAPDPPVTMTSTLRRTSSAARPGKRSALPSAERHSNATLCPST